MKTMDGSLYEKGKSLILQEKYDEALKYFNDLYKDDKQNSNYPNYIGIIHVLKEDYKKAADAFKEAIELDPDSWYPYQRLGQICTIKNIRKCAIDYFTQTIERDPSNTYALINLALLFQKEDRDTAKDLINSALKVDPVNLIANYLSGTMCINTCEYEEAERLLTKVIEKNPQFLMGWYKLGVLYFKSNKLKKAIEALTNALTISKKPYIMNLLGLIQLHRKKLKEAVMYFKESIKYEPNDPSTWINLADTYLRTNNTASSKLCLKEAMEILEKSETPKDDDKKVAIWLNLANCYDKEAKPNFSLYCLEKAREYSVKGIDLEQDYFDQDEAKMEVIHRISMSIERKIREGVTAQTPDDLDLKKLIE